VRYSFLAPQLENLFCNARDVNKVEALSEARIKLGDLGAAVQVRRRRSRSQHDGITVVYKAVGID
jgi:hypothetical protein